MSATTPAERLRFALDLFEFGEQMMRTRLRREHTEWSDAEIDEALKRWLAERPGAELGDCPGRPRPFRAAPNV